MNTHKKCFLISYVCLLLFACVDGYTLNHARPISKFNISKQTSYTNLVNQSFIDVIKNIDCREIESTGVQAGCILEQHKILNYLTNSSTYSTYANRPSVNTPNMICYKDMGGYTEFKEGYHIVIMKDNNTEIPLNRTLYPKGVRIYNK